MRALVALGYVPQRALSVSVSRTSGAGAVRVPLAPAPVSAPVSTHSSTVSARVCSVSTQACTVSTHTCVVFAHTGTASFRAGTVSAHTTGTVPTHACTVAARTGSVSPRTSTAVPTYHCTTIPVSPNIVTVPADTGTTIPDARAGASAVFLLLMISLGHAAAVASLEAGPAGRVAAPGGERFGAGAELLAVLGSGSAGLGAVALRHAVRARLSRTEALATSSRSASSTAAGGVARAVRVSSAPSRGLREAHVTILGRPVRASRGLGAAAGPGGLGW